MKIEIRGFKAVDQVVDLSRLSVITGANGSGKSALADAIRFIALGYVPALGKRPRDTAQLVRGRAATVRLTLDDGRMVTRTLDRSGTGWSVTTRCSWLGRATSREHGAAARALWGAEDIDVAESLDIRQLLASTPNQRSSRIQQLLSMSLSNPAEQAHAVALLTLQRITGTDDARMPADWHVMDGMLSDCERASISDHLSVAKSAILDGGIATAITAANERKRTEMLLLRDKKQASAEIERRLQALGIVPGRSVAELRDALGQAERKLGSAQERRREHTRKCHVVAEVCTALDEASEAHRAALLVAEKSDCAQRREELRVRACAIILPDAPVQSDSVVTLETEAEALDAEARAILVIEPLDYSAEIAAEAAAHTIHKNFAESPWANVASIAAEIGTATTSTAVRALVSDLLAIASANIGDVRGAMTKWVAAKDALAEATVHAKRVSEMRAENSKRRHELQDAAAKLRQQASQQQAEFARILAAHHADLQDAMARRDALKSEAAGIEDKQRCIDVAVARTSDALRAAQARWEDHGDEPTAPGDDLDDLRGYADEASRRLIVAQGAAALRAELESIRAEIEALRVSGLIWAAIEWALQRAREEEITKAGGPLLGAMEKFLDAAGAAERPYFHAESGACDIGWVCKENEVPIAALSGGEYVLFAAALTAAVIALRNAPIGCLIVEAAECDDAMLAQLLCGISGVADSLTLALVMTPRYPVEVDGWNKIQLLGEDGLAQDDSKAVTETADARRGRMP